MGEGIAVVAEGAAAMSGDPNWLSRGGRGELQAVGALLLGDTAPVGDLYSYLSPTLACRFAAPQPFTIVRALLSLLRH